MKKNPKYIQIIQAIKKKIEAGDYPIGSRLPSERKLAEYFKVNRSTVIRSYEELTSEGILERRIGSGTYVSQNYNHFFEEQTNWYQVLSKRPSISTNIYLQKNSHVKKEALDLSTGELSSKLIPNFNFKAFDWSEIADKKQSVSGLIDLKIAIAGHLHKQNICVNIDEILITSGARQALFLILQVLLSPGDIVAIESPSFLFNLPLFQSAGIKTVKIPLLADKQAIDLIALENELKKQSIKFLILNPNFHNPTGITLNNTNRQQLIKLANEYHVPIIEDDVFQLFNFSKANIQPLFQLDKKNVIYLGSLSKILGSNISIGWCIAPSFMVAKLAQARELMDFNLNIFPQILATQAFNSPKFNRKIEQTNSVLNQKQQELLIIMKEFPNWSASSVKGGFYQWLTFHRDLTSDEFDYFIEEKLLVAPSFLFGNQKNAIRINISKIDDFELFKQKFSVINKRLA